MNSITTLAIIEGIRARKDRSLGLSVTTPELTTPEKAMFLELQGINVKIQITPLDEKEIENHEVAADLDQKSQSQRIRSVLFILWKQDPRGMEFQDYYKMQTEKYIEWLKGKIENE